MSGTTMKSTATAKPRFYSRRPPVRTALAYEACLIHILESIGTSSKPALTDQEKQKLHYFDLRPHRVSLKAYREKFGELLRLTLTANPALEAVKPRLQTELTGFLERYENLLLGITVGRASSKQVRWALCERFFIPWAALRTAFHLRHPQVEQAGENKHWFLPPVTGGKLGSCLMRILDRQVRHADETEEAFAHRLCGHSNADVKSEIAINLGRDLRRYRAGDGPPSIAKVRQIIGGCPNEPDLQAKLVLSAAIDRNVHKAVSAFGPEHALSLVKYFSLAFKHFSELLKSLTDELPTDDDKAWIALQSQTFTGNTPFEAEQFYPLTDPFLHALGRIISAKLAGADRRGRLTAIPAGPSAFGRGSFPKSTYHRLPVSVELAFQKRDFQAAVVASQAIYPSASAHSAEAARLADFFAKLGLDALKPELAGRGPIPTEPASEVFLNEARRLFQASHARSEGREKTEIGIRLLRFLLQPQRPKAKSDRPMARRLYRAANKFYRETNRHGSASCLYGCLLWLEGDKQRALAALLNAAEYGRASCGGEDWIWLLRFAPMLAEELSRKRDLNSLVKLADHEGVKYREPSPRTKKVMMEMQQREEVAMLKLNFRPFPS